MKVMCIKANALNPKIFGPPTLGIRVERKPPTVPVPFKLTEISRKRDEKMKREEIEEVARNQKESIHKANPI
jgi:hypothetical protein